jgi:hypothetical protein
VSRVESAGLSPGEALLVGFGLACMAVLLIAGTVAWLRDLRAEHKAWRALVAELTERRRSTRDGPR